MRKQFKWVRLAAVVALASSSGCNLSALQKQLEDQAKKDVMDAIPPYTGGQIMPAAPGVMNAQQMVGTQGGQVSTTHGGVGIPPGALPQNVQVAVTEESMGALAAPLPAMLTPAAPPVAFTPHGTTFTEPVMLSLFFTPTSPNVVVLRLDNEQDTTWEVVQAMVNGNTANVVTTHFSVYMACSCGNRSPTSNMLCTQVAHGQAPLDDLNMRKDPGGADGGIAMGGGPGGDFGGGSSGGMIGGGSTGPAIDPVPCNNLAMCKELQGLCINDPQNALCGMYLSQCKVLEQTCPPPGAGDGGAAGGGSTGLPPPPPPTDGGLPPPPDGGLPGGGSSGAQTGSTTGAAVDPALCAYVAMCQSVLTQCQFNYTPECDQCKQLLSQCPPPPPGP